MGSLLGATAAQVEDTGRARGKVAEDRVELLAGHVGGHVAGDGGDGTLTTPPRTSRARETPA